MTFLTVPWSQPQAVQTLLLVGPAEEPFTVEEIKVRASMMWPVTDPPDPRDAMIHDFIVSARHKVEVDTGLALLTQTRRATFTTAAVCGVVPMPANCLPVQSVTDVTDSTRRLVGRVSGRGLAPGRWSTTRDIGLAFPAHATRVLEIVAGWPSLAALKAEAPTLYQAVALLAVHYATLGRDLAITGAVASINVVPEGYDALIAPHRLVWVI